MSRSGQSRFSVSRIRRNHGNRTSIVERIATMATLTTSVVRRNCPAVSAFVACGIYYVNYSLLAPGFWLLAPGLASDCWLCIFLSAHSGALETGSQQPIASSQQRTQVVFSLCLI